MRMWKIIKGIFWIISPVGIFLYGISLVNLFGIFIYSPALKIAGIGVITGILFWWISGRWLEFFHVFEHELTHLIFGIIFLKRPKAFVATDKGGLVELYGDNFFITLSPYFFPTFSYLLLISFPFVKPDYHPYFYLFLGFITGYHIISTYQEFNLYQPDIRRTGITFSVIFSLFANILTLGFLIAFIAGGFEASIAFLKDGIYNIIPIVEKITQIKKFLSL